MLMMRTSATSFVFLLVLSHLLVSPGRAQSAGVVTGRVVTENTGSPLPGVNVVLQEAGLGAATDPDGAFHIDDVPPGPDTLQAQFVGYRTARRAVTVRTGDTTRVELTLSPTTVQMEGVQVTTLRPTLQTRSVLEATAVREANPRDPGELLRTKAGIEAVRRGPVGLDPVVRGLRETEVGVYLDGTRMFPAGPARMDSPISHLDPSNIKSMEIVKGPYALTWGAGNLSAIRVETHSLRTLPTEPVHGTFTGGYDTNLNAFNSSLSLQGRPGGSVAYRLNGAWREGNDYTSGAGTTIPGTFRSREVRGALGYLANPTSKVVVSGGYQNQRDMDYPGRLLNADYFDTYNLSARWTLDQQQGMIRSAEVLGYFNAVDHGMDNDGKPTAQPEPDRMPPFALDVRIESGVDISGGRAALTLAPSGLTELELGADAYSALRNATRTIHRQDDGKLLFEDLVWPDARITDVGLFARASQTFGAGWRTVATARLDVVRANADTASTFFRTRVAEELATTEVTPSAAFTVSYLPNDHWTATLGVGSAARTADATERYSDRLPASKAQTSAEFVGTPDLEPERSTQIDLWLEAQYPQWSVSMNGFARRLTNYITLRATDLPKRLPLSPSTVFAYRNGTATFYGGEATAAVRLRPALTAQLQASYLWGRDQTVDEPALGVSPPQSTLSLRYEPDGGRFFAEGTVHLVGEQDRVATTRGETPTDGYTTFDLKGGLTLTERASLQVGITNLTDESYVHHLNAKNPFTGRQLPEPGRVLFADLTVSF